MPEAVQLTRPFRIAQFARRRCASSGPKSLVDNSCAPGVIGTTTVPHATRLLMDDELFEIARQSLEVVGLDARE